MGREGGAGREGAGTVDAGCDFEGGGVGVWGGGGELEECGAGGGGCEGGF